MNNHQWRVYRANTSEYCADNFKINEKELLEQIPGVSYVEDWDKNPNIVLTNTQTIIEELPAEKLKDVELIIHPNSGYDKFSVDFVSEFKKPILVGNSIRAQAVSQYILASLLNHYAQPPFDGEWDSLRSWNRPLLSNLSIQVYGYGHIGKILESTLAALDCNIRIYDPWKDKQDLNIEDADVIILACSLNDKNKKFINSEFLSRLKKDVTLINAARGGLVEQSALIDFLFENQRTTAYLDVFQSEPFSTDEFKKLSNAALTSHVAGVHASLDSSMFAFEQEVIQNFTVNRKEFENFYNELILSNRIRDNFLI